MCIMVNVSIIFLFQMREICLNLSTFCFSVTALQICCDQLIALGDDMTYTNRNLFVQHVLFHQVRKEQ